MSTESLPTRVVKRFASRLRFPTLFGVTAALFVADLVFPDAIPLVDEVLLGLATLLLSAWKSRGGDDDGDGADAESGEGGGVETAGPRS